ncbi:MAG: tetratricopeptide repeat protein [Candidatus Omnitrophota bacterium]
MNRVIASVHKKPDSWILCSLLFVLLLIYGRSLAGPFIWDDYSLIVNNPDIGNPWFFFSHSLYPSSPDSALSYYRPLQALSYFLDFRIWRFHAAGYHLSNILLHWLNAFLIFRFVKSVSESRWAGFLASLLFALNPVFTTSVTYISGRADLLLLFFVLLSLASLKKFLQTRSLGFYACSMAFFICALLSKESALLFPLLVFAYLAVFRNRKAGFEGFVPLAGYLGVAILFFLFRIQIFAGPGALLRFSPASLWTAVQMPLRYLLLFFFPLDAYMGRSIPLARSFFEPFTLASVVFYGLVIYASLRRLGKNPVVYFCGLWFFLSIVPLSLYDILFGGTGSDIIMPDNNLYLASLGLVFLAGYGLAPVVRGPKKAARFALVFVYCAFLAQGTVRANEIWRDEILFYERLLERNSSSRSAYLIHGNLGLAYKRRGELKKAAKAYEKALAIKDDADIHHNLGNVFLEAGRARDARQEYLEALRLRPDFALSYIGLGLVYSQEGRPELAREMFDKAMDLDPSDFQVRELVRDLIAARD